MILHYSSDLFEDGRLVRANDGIIVTHTGPSHPEWFESIREEIARRFGYGAKTHNICIRSLTVLEVVHDEQ
jgi:hypothetical protein